MMRYAYRAVRKSDGVEMHVGEITDGGAEGMSGLAETIKILLIDSHPLAKGLDRGEIDVELRALT